MSVYNTRLKPLAAASFSLSSSSFSSAFVHANSRVISSSRQKIIRSSSSSSNNRNAFCFQRFYDRLSKNSIGNRNSDRKFSSSDRFNRHSSGSSSVFQVGPSYILKAAGFVAAGCLIAEPAYCKRFDSNTREPVEVVNAATETVEVVKAATETVEVVKSVSPLSSSSSLTDGSLSTAAAAVDDDNQVCSMGGLNSTKASSSFSSSSSSSSSLKRGNKTKRRESKIINLNSQLDLIHKENQKQDGRRTRMNNTAIFSGGSNKQLAERIARCLNTDLGRIHLTRFSDGEVSLQFLDSLRGKDVYIIQSTSPPVNENLMELLFMISTCRRSSAKKITAIIPYYGYARQDRKLSSRVPISAADVARMIEAMGVDRVIAVDLHSGQIQGFFGPQVPVDNLEAQLIGLEYFAHRPLEKPIVVSPDAGGVYRARKFQEAFRSRAAVDAGIAMLVKQRSRANEIDRMDVVGNVEGSDVIIVDDMIDTAGTLCEAAAHLRAKGAKRVFAFATHGLFSGPALKRIEQSVLEEIVVTDSIPLSPEVAKCSRITQLSIASLIAEGIDRINHKESLNSLFIA